MESRLIFNVVVVMVLFNLSFSDAFTPPGVGFQQTTHNGRFSFTTTPTILHPWETPSREWKDSPDYGLEASVAAREFPRSPLGTLSQAIVVPAKRGIEAVSQRLGIDREKISSLGVSFGLSYSIISNINGAISLSIAWYMSSMKTGLSPLAPGQWKSLLACYGTIYGIIQVLKPFRIAAAIAMAKPSGKLLQHTQTKFNCSKTIAIMFQYLLGLLAWGTVASVGVLTASGCSHVPIF